MNFLMVLVRHNRIKFLPAIMDCYDRLWQNYKGYVQVMVTVPQVMDNDWICKIGNDIESALNQKISLKLSIDPSVIGGIVIHYGNKVVDNTIRTRLLGTVKAVTSAEKLWMKTNEV
jgi:F-type H+-transporting ATPase subunit delta